MAYKPKKYTIADAPPPGTKPPEQMNLLELFQQGDRTSLTSIKENHTGALVYAIIHMVQQNDIQKANVLTKLLDIVHKYADTTTNVMSDDSLTSFLKDKKKRVLEPNFASLGEPELLTGPTTGTDVIDGSND